MNALSLFVAISAIVAALNPPTLAVIIMSVTSLLGKGKHPRHAALHTLVFSAGVLVTYTVVALLFRALLLSIPVGIAGYIGLALGAMITLFGLLEIKDYFWYGKGLSFKLSASAEKSIHAWTKKHHGHLRGFILGIYTAVRLSHYTIILVLSSTLLITLLSPGSVAANIAWALWYIAPLLVISFLLAFGVSAYSLTTWKEQTKHSMRLSVGIIYIMIGWVILAVLAGGLKLV